MPISSHGSSAPRSSARLRPLARADRDGLKALLVATAAFFEEEVKVALELIDLGVTPGGGGYRFVVAELDGKVAGYACFGATPLTDGVWDLYWIAVDPAHQGSGIASDLLAAVEREIVRDDARMLLIETASKPSYARQRAFYLKSGYLEVARVPDFYAVGDDRVIYAKELPMKSETKGETKSGLEVANLDTATFKCVYPVCGGICCQNGRPGLEPGERERIEKNLEKFLPHMRPSAKKLVEAKGFLTNRIKDGKRMLAVTETWCVFFNEGCVLHKVGAEEGNRWAYKPWHCVTFPLERGPRDRPAWRVRQWGTKGEVWKLFCLNPKESPVPARESLESEIAFAEGMERGDEDWRRIDEDVEAPRRGERETGG